MHDLLKSHLFIIALLTSLAVQAGNKALDEKIVQQKQAMKDQINRIRTSEYEFATLKDEVERVVENLNGLSGEELEQAKEYFGKNVDLFLTNNRNNSSTNSEDLSFKSRAFRQPDHSLKSIFSTRNIIIATVITLISINLLYLWKKSKKEKIIIKAA